MAQQTPGGRQRSSSNTDNGEWLRELAIDYNVHPTKVPQIAGKWQTETAFLDFLSDGGDVTDLAGIGERTRSRVFEWVATTHPDVLETHYRNSPRYISEIRVGDTDNVRYTCPREASPDEEMNAAFDCQNCGATTHIRTGVDTGHGDSVICGKCHWRHTILDAIDASRHPTE